MEDEKTSDIAITVTILDTAALGRISAVMKTSGRVTVQLQYGKVKIRGGDDYLTGSFSSVKRMYVDATGQYMIWRECRFGELSVPEPGHKTRLILDGIPYEMIIATSFLSQENSNDDEAERKLCIGYTDIIEKFVPHTCNCDCIPWCPAGVWVRE